MQFIHDAKSGCGVIIIAELTLHIISFDYNFISRLVFEVMYSCDL